MPKLLQVFPFWFILFLVIGVCFAVLWLMTQPRRTSPQLRWVILASYVVRIVLAVTLFGIARLDLPIASSLHTPDGFWAFGPDSFVYDMFARKFVYAWEQGLSLPTPHVEVEFIVMLGALYSVLGEHPLFAILLNAACGAGLGIVGYHIGRHLFDERAGLWSAILIAWWPSTFIWSAQLLKDAPSFLLMMSILYLMTCAIDRPSRGRWTYAYQGMLWIAIGVLVILMTRLRFYVGIIMAVAMSVCCAGYVIYAVRRRVRGGVFTLCGVTLTVVLSMSISRTLDVSAFVEPNNPGAGHWRVAVEAWKYQDMNKAAQHFADATAHQIAEAHLGLAMTAYAVHEPEPSLQELFIFFHEGREPHGLRAGYALARHIFEEMQHEVELDQRVPPSEMSTYLGMSIVYLYTGEVDKSYEMLQHARGYKRSLGATQDLSLAADMLRAKIAQLDVPAHDGYVVQAALAPWEGTLEVLLVDTLKSYIHTAEILPSRMEDNRYIVGSEAAAVHATVAMVDAILGAQTTNVEATSMPALDDQVTDLMATSMPTRQDAQHATASPTIMRRLASATTQISTGAVRTMQDMDPVAVGHLRQGFVHEGGHAQMDNDIKLSMPWEIFAYAPRALLIAVFAPFPWQWFDTGGSTGAMRLFAGGETMILYTLLPGICIGIRRAKQGRLLGSLYLLLFIGMLAMGLAMVVTNLGILFRLRLQYILPVLIFAGGGGGWSIYGQWWRRYATHHRSPEPAVDEEERLTADVWS